MSNNEAKELPSEIESLQLLADNLDKQIDEASAREDYVKAHELHSEFKSTKAKLFQAQQKERNKMMAITISNYAKGISSGVIAVLSGAVIVIIVRALKHSSVWTQFGIGMPIYATVMCIITTFYWKCSPSIIFNKLKQIKLIDIIASFLMACQSLAVTIAILMTTVANTAFIINTTAVFCIVFDRIILKEPFRIRNVVLVIFGLISTGIIIGGDTNTDPQHMAGNFIALANPICWALYWCINRKGSKDGPDDSNTKNLSQFEKILIYQILCAIYLSLAGLIGGIEKETIQPQDLIMYFISYGVFRPVCVMFFSLAPIYISTTEIGCVKMLETIVYPLAIYIYAGEIPSISTFVGGPLLVVSLLIHICFTIQAERGVDTKVYSVTNLQSKDLDTVGTEI